MKETLTILLTCVMMLSCAPSREERARATFEQALTQYKSQNFNAAKILLDSIIYTYPDQKQLVRESRDMMHIVYRTEQERNLLFLDSLLEIRESEIAPLMKDFQEEDPNANMPILISKKQSVGRSFERSLVKAHTDKNGGFFISSHYTGETPINHIAIKAEVDGQYLVSDTITDDVLNHAFENDGQIWEAIRYKNASDNGVAEFIASNFDKKIRITLLTPKGNGYHFMMTETDKEAVRETYYLAALLRETIQIKGQIRNVKTAMKRLK